MRQKEAVLRCIGDGAKTISEITETTGVKRESVRRVLSELRQKGMVQKTNESFSRVVQ